MKLDRCGGKSQVSKSTLISAEKGKGTEVEQKPASLLSRLVEGARKRYWARQTYKDPVSGLREVYSSFHAAWDAVEKARLVPARMFARLIRETGITPDQNQIMRPTSPMESSSWDEFYLEVCSRVVRHELEKQNPSIPEEDKRRNQKYGH